MAIPAEMLRALAARDLMSLVRQLAKAAADFSAEKINTPPRLTLHLRSGRDLSGVLHHFDDNDRGPTLLLRSDGRAGPEGVSFVALADVEAISIADAESLLPYLLAGHLEVAASAGPEPGRLRLKRRLKELNDQVVAAFGAPLTLAIDVEALSNSQYGTKPLAPLIELIGEALLGLAKDPTNREAILARVKRITVVTGSERGVAIAGNDLKVTVPAPGSGFSYSACEALVTDIEKAF